MYFWKINELKKDLVDGTVSEHETFKYLMANTILYSVATIQYGSANDWDSIGGVITCAITILGLLFIYKCNNGANGKNILERYNALGWVVFIRLLVLFFIPVIIISFTLQEIYFGGVPDETSLIDMLSIPVLEAGYVLMLAKHINDVAKKAHA